MFSKIGAWKANQDVEEPKDTPKGINFNEEYNKTLRTKSYVDFFNKVQLLADQPSNKFPENFLEPGQETILNIVDSTTLSRAPELKSLMLSYLDISAEASHVCSNLLRSINQGHSNDYFIQRGLDIKNGEYSLENSEQIISELNSFIHSNNTFSNHKNHDFKLINEKHSSLLHHLKSMKTKLGRKIRLKKLLKKTIGVCVTAACGLAAMTGVVIATNALTALILGPAILCFPLKQLQRKLQTYELSREGYLNKAYDQLDIAARGTYILNKEFETISRLVARVHDEIEHYRTLMQFCLDRKEDRFSLHVKELKKSEAGFRAQVEELQERLCLCLVTINRARALVIEEMERSI